MIKLEETEVIGWEHTIRGMRNPMNSWGKSDSDYCDGGDCKNCAVYVKLPKGNEMCTQPFLVGAADRELMMKLANGGPVHAKYRRMIAVYVDITAPLYWWKEFDRYKVGTVANSCSTMHKIHEKEFTLEDFSHEHLLPYNEMKGDYCYIKVDDGWFTSPLNFINKTIEILNYCRAQYLETKNKWYWWQMIQLLPSSYNQKRTVMLNYEVLAGIYTWRKNHKLDEWREFCKWIESLPLSGIITGETGEVSKED